MFQEYMTYDVKDNLPSLCEIRESIRVGHELSAEELNEIRPDLVEYLRNLQNRLGRNDYAESVKVFCAKGEIILAGADDRPRQESNYAVVRENDIYIWAGNARGDGHLNEFANNTDGYVPSSRYHFENATYVINMLGQVETIYEYHETARRTDRNEQRPDLRKVCEAKGGRPTDVGGHLVAHNIDGPTEAINIIPMDGSFNNGGEWKSMETLFQNEYSCGRSFTVKKTIQYNDLTGLPSHIEVDAFISGQRKRWSFDLP